MAVSKTGMPSMETKGAQHGLGQVMPPAGASESPSPPPAGMTEQQRR